MSLHHATRACAALLLGFSCVALAAPKVDDDGLPEPGERKLELQLDRASRPGPGAAGAARPLNVVAEVAYGLRENWQVAVKALLALERGRSRGEGLVGEVRYVAPHDEERGGYWGVNAGLHYQTPEGEPRQWEAELVPVLGYRLGRLHAMANLGFTHALSGEEKKLMFGMAAKLSYRLNEKHARGWSTSTTRAPCPTGCRGRKGANTCSSPGTARSTRRTSTSAWAAASPMPPTAGCSS